MTALIVTTPEALEALIAKAVRSALASFRPTKRPAGKAWLTPREAAPLMGCSATTAWLKAQRGQIPPAALTWSGKEKKRVKISREWAEGGQ